MFGHVATATGWTLHEIEQLTLWELNDLMAYWKDYPPTHVLVGAYLMNAKARSTKRQKANGQDIPSNYQQGGLEELAREVNLAGGSVLKKLPEMYRQSYTWQEKCL